MRRHQQVDCLGGQTGPHLVNLPLQVGVVQALSQNPCVEEWPRQSATSIISIFTANPGPPSRIISALKHSTSTMTTDPSRSWDPPSLTEASCKAFWDFLVPILCLTRRQFDLQGRADEGHQGGGEVDRVVVRDGHVHLHQPLKQVEAERRSREPAATNHKSPVSCFQNLITGYLVG